MPASMDAREIKRVATATAAEGFWRSGDQFMEEDCGGESVKGSCEEVVLDESVMYMDEEAMFDMLGLLVNMAEGLLEYIPWFIHW
jgi:EREBP-like factor